MAKGLKSKLKKILPLALSAIMAVSGFAACNSSLANVGSLSATSSTDELGANVNFSNWGGAAGITQTSAYTWKDGKTGANAYDEQYQDKYFFSDQHDAVTYFANAMYQDYGYLSPSNQPYVGVGVGWTPAWFEWMALIRNWSDNLWAYHMWRGYIIDQPMQADGYVWSYDTPHWPNIGSTKSCSAGGCGNYHYDNNFCYVMAICNYIGWENDLSLLDEVDPKTGPFVVDAGHEANSSWHVSQGHDVSKDLTVGQKMQMAIDYILNRLNGKNGLIVITGNNDNCNNGTVNDYSCNYWDNIPFGYKDVYANILFYKMLNYLVEFETFRGDTVKAKYYSDLAATTKHNFNVNFWSASNHRYISTVDSQGVARDHGITFVNTEAIACGLAEGNTDSGRPRATWIYEWLNGTRQISGETAYDIYPTTATTSQPVGQSNGVVMRVNTIDFARTGWWHDNGGSQALSGNGKYGSHLENGGGILYTAYYDVMARVKMGDVQGAYGHMNLMAREYAKDELNRDPMNTTSGSSDVLGFVGEYSESGLAPMGYLYGFIGLSLMAGGLKFDPAIPSGYKYMGVNRLRFDDRSYTVTVHRDGVFSVECAEGVDMLAKVANVSSTAARGLTFYDEDHNIIERRTLTPVNGYYVLEMKGVENATFVELR